VLCCLLLDCLLLLAQPAHAAAFLTVLAGRLSPDSDGRGRPLVRVKPVDRRRVRCCCYLSELVRATGIPAVSVERICSSCNPRAHDIMMISMIRIGML
jgi:hypothetical protein